MNPHRFTGRPLVAVLFASLICGLFSAEIVRGQARFDTVPLSNDDLDGVFDFVPQIVEDDGTVSRVGTTGRRLMVPNLAAARILNRLDIDGDGLADNSRDTDGDGLPDNWEAGGFESLTAAGLRVDRTVFYPAPTPIVPGTPPTPIFTRLAVATSALDPDTDRDGLTDYVEVFGLMFIDEDGNGLLDNGLEWEDKNRDGLPSPGEFPLDNAVRPGNPNGARAGFGLLHDFDGFVFTDPTNADTDGDSQSDGEDKDPLINPRAFGLNQANIVRITREDDDLDEDGLGNGMDMGNDLLIVDGNDENIIPRDFQVIDNPDNIEDLLEFFRRDLLQETPEPVIPESAIEDLLGADWDGNGLWRTTDVRTWFLLIDPSDPENFPAESDFVIDGQNLFATQTFDDLHDLIVKDQLEPYGGRGIGMGWQNLLEPSGSTQFIPDRRVWSILYSWRMPGFDIDGDGFVGVPNISATAARINDDGEEVATVGLRRENRSQEYMISNSVLISDSIPDAGEDNENNIGPEIRPFDDRIRILNAPDSLPPDSAAGSPVNSDLDGQIEAPDNFPAIPLGGCGPVGMVTLFLSFVGLSLMRWWR